MVTRTLFFVTWTSTRSLLLWQNFPFWNGWAGQWANLSPWLNGVDYNRQSQALKLFVKKALSFCFGYPPLTPPRTRSHSREGRVFWSSCWVQAHLRNTMQRRLLVNFDAGRRNRGSTKFSSCGSEAVTVAFVCFPTASYGMELRPCSMFFKILFIIDETSGWRSIVLDSSQTFYILTFA